MQRISMYYLLAGWKFVGIWLLNYCFPMGNEKLHDWNWVNITVIAPKNGKRDDVGTSRQLGGGRARYTLNGEAGPPGHSRAVPIPAILWGLLGQLGGSRF